MQTLNFLHKGLISLRVNNLRVLYMRCTASDFSKFIVYRKLTLFDVGLHEYLNLDDITLP